MSEARNVWKSLLWSLGAWLVHCMAVFVVTMVLVGCVPRFVKLFENYDADIPAATVLVIQLSEMAVNYWYTLLVPLALDALMLIGLSLSPAKVRWLARAWSGLVLAFAFVLLAFAILAISLPFESIGVSLPNAADAERSTSESNEPAVTPISPAQEPQADAER